MYKCIGNWTKERMIEVIKREFKGKAVTKYGTCKYRTEDGKKCIVGCFIPDNHKYLDDIVYDNFLCNDSKFKEYGLDLPLDYNDLRELQKKHDGLDNEQEVQDQLEVLVNWVEYNVD